MTTTIKITELTDIGANLASSTVFPVVNMAGTPTTEKTVLANIANLILAGAGTDYVGVNVAETANMVTGSNVVGQVGYAAVANSIAGSNVFGAVGTAGTAGTVTTNAQPNITSVGSLTSLTTVGGLTVNNASATVNFITTANVTLGNVSNLHIAGGTAGQLLSTDGNGTLSWASDTTTYGNSNVVSLLSAFGSNTISTTGNISVGNITATNLGNVSTINRDGNSSNVLYGNGVFAAIAGGANIGNVTFNDINIIGTGNLKLQPDSANASAYLDIFLTGGPDIHIAGNGQTVILGTDEQANVAVNVDGNVSIQAGNVSGTQTWNFGTAGNLTLPRGGVVYETNIPDGGLNGNTIALAPSGGTNADQQLLIYPTTNDANHLHLTSGNLYSTELFLGDDNLYVKLANTGNIVINSNDGAGNTAQWTFGTAGNLTLPDTTSVIANVSITLEANDTGNSTGLSLIGDYHANLYAHGNVTIVSDSSNTTATWTFGDDGSTIFPTLTVQRGDNPSGTITGQTLLFGDAAQEAIISTADGTVSNENSQRLVINPGQGYDYGEGGDIYLWAGRGGADSGSGGDVKIRGGFAPADGTGGYIRIDGGESQGNGAPGFIEITGGQGGTTTGGYVQITGGVGGNGTGGAVDIIGGFGNQGPGANVSITGGGSANGLSEYGNVNINAGASAWHFDNTGNLTVPGNLIGPASANFTIYSNAAVHEFVFADDGTFYAPDIVVLGGNTIYIGPGANTLAGLEHAVMIASSNHNAYIQAVINNVSDNGSADWVAQGRLGDDTGGWADFGFTSGGFNDANYTITGPGDGYLLVESYAPGQLLTGPKGGNLILATGSQGTVRDIIFGTGGFETGNIFGRMSDANNSFELSRAGATIKFPNATEQNTAWTGSVDTGNVTGLGNISTINLDGNVSNLLTGSGTYVAIPIVPTVGNISTINLDGNISNVLRGDGTWGTDANSSYGNSNVASLLGAFGSNSISTTGNISVGNANLGNVATANYFAGNGGTLSNVATKVEGSWTLASGTNTVNISVPLNGTYSIWVNGNIPNGIVTYTATAVVTNTNVPVLGEQYAWYYSVGNALVFTSIPDQFTGTVGSISTVNTYSGNTANVFTFGITNNSGNTAVVNYGYTKL